MSGFTVPRSPADTDPRTDTPSHDSLLGAPLPHVPRLSAWQSVRRHPVVFLLPVFIAVAAAIAIGLTRPTQYEAQSRLGIARVDVTTPGALAGYANGASQLAETYSRTMSADEVRAAVGKRLGISPRRLEGRLKANPVPGTPVFRITATAQSAAAAIELANVGSDELVRYIGRLNRPGFDAPELLKRYENAATTLQTAIAERDLAKRAYERSDTSANLERLVAARAATQVAQIRTDALEESYRTNTQTGARRLVQILARPTKASTDRDSKLQILAFVGLLGGIAVGVALAVLVAARRARRFAF